MFSSLLKARKVTLCLNTRIPFFVKNKSTVSWMVPIFAVAVLLDIGCNSQNNERRSCHIPCVRLWINASLNFLIPFTRNYMSFVLADSEKECVR